jgi:AcrR family transcriptional regulator
MKKQRSDALKTRLNLLEAASEIFGKKGFWNATNEDICNKANANLAAINYHFGSKENLYIESWKYSFEKSMEKHPPEGGALPNDPAEKRMKGRILSFLQRIADPETHDIDIILKEMANPTGLLTEVIASTIELVDRDFISTLKELMGEGSSEELIGFCHMSLLSMCFGPMLHLRSVNEDDRTPRSGIMPLDLGVENLADHIIKFTLAGIRSFSETSK